VSDILIVEDEEDLGYALASVFRRLGHDVKLAPTGQAALEASRTGLYDAVLLDLNLPDANGFDILSKLAAQDPSCPIIIQTAQDDAASAVRALQLGAMSYLTKPARRELIEHAVETALESASLRRRIEAYRRAGPGEELIAVAPAFREVMRQIETAAKAPRTAVHITGESGSGKELAAKLLHRWSPRAAAPLVSVNAACFPPSMLESELFGHEAGAFTGARGQRRGLFELAASGTLFLDEIGELPLELQPRLLRVMEGHPFRRLGGEKEIRVDVRLISATNRNLRTEVATGRFREDLYHRLRVIEIRLPPLRERREDIKELAVHFLARIAGELGRHDVSFSAGALDRLESYEWPGNVRELRNVVERALVLCRGPQIFADDLPIDAAPAPPRAVGGAPVPDALADVVRLHIERVYAECGGNLSHTATRLGLSRVALRRRLREYGLKPTT
jgi:DNA-binding NtrC family response regulator